MTFAKNIEKELDIYFGTADADKANGVLAEAPASDVIPTIEDGIEYIKKLAIEDYKAFMSPTSDVRTKMFNEFVESWEVRPGSKYIKIISNKSVWGFIVATDKDKKFKKGDILKPAGWATPARNFARGNVLEGDFSGVRWTSAG